jgi:Flp pilus assembly pilin Flp
MAHNDIEGAVAFLLGLCALNLIAGVVTLSERIKDDPIGFWKRKE